MANLSPCEALEYVKGVLPVPPYICTRDVEDALEFLRREGRVVLKVSSARVVHKTDVGGVVLNVEDEETLEQAFYRLLELAGPEGEVLVQKQIDGVEFFLGGKEDPQFGPIVLFGLGGVYVELYKDVVARVAPIDVEEAKGMLEEIKGRVIFGFRGRRVDKNVLANIIARFSEFVYERRPKEMDVNPLKGTDKNFYAVDVRVVL